jgi:hypothetical protein
LTFGNAGTGIDSCTSDATLPRRTLGLTALALLLAFALAGVFSNSASAAISRPLLKQINFSNQNMPMGVSTDAAGNIYAAVANFDGEGSHVEKFDPNGNPLNFSGSATYIKGNKLFGPSADLPLEIDSGFPAGIAVTTSGGPTNGYIYVTAFWVKGGLVYAYKPNGEFAGYFDQTGNEFGVNYTCSLALNHTTADVHVGYGFYINKIRRYGASTEPTGGASTGTINTADPQTCALALDNAGNVYTVPGEYAGGPIFQYPSTSFGQNPAPRTEIYPAPVNALSYDTVSGHLFADRGGDIVEITTAGAQVNAPFGGISNSRGVAVATGDRVHAVSNGQRDGANSGSIQTYGPPVALPIDTTEPASEVLQLTATLNGKVDPDGSGNVTKCEFQWGRDARYLEAPLPCEQATPYASPTAVSAKLTGLLGKTVYHYRLVTTSANGVQTGHDAIFTTPDYVADVATGDANPVKKNLAVLHGSYRAQGLETEYWFELGTEFGVYTKKIPVTPNKTGLENGPQEVDPVEVTGLQGATEYHYRIVMKNELGPAVAGGERSFTTPPAITNIKTGDVEDVGNESAVLNGSFTADEFEVHYYFEWGPTEAYGNKTPAFPGTAIAPGSGTVDVPPVLLEGLQEGGIYHYRLVGTNVAGTTFGEDRIFKTAEPPQINNLAAKNVKATSAELTAEVNPNRGETEWFFEWGPTTSFGNKTPVPSGKIPYGSEAVPVSTTIENLTVGTTYYFRLVAENEFGVRKSGEQAFGFYPASCPNAQIRQETGSSHLPECRGYELVSPANAHGTLLFPYNAPTSSEATSPSRYIYSAGYGDPGVGGEPIIAITDLYVSTRSSAGWNNKYVGLSAKESTFVGGAPHRMIFGTTGYGPSNSMVGTAVDANLDKVVLYDNGYPGFYKEIEPPSNAPFVFDAATGAKLDRWPTGVEDVNKGTGFVGWQEYSDDMSHFVFSSNVAFVPGAEAFEDQIQCCSYMPSEWQPGRCCSAPIYDNDTLTGDIELVSIREDGSRFWGTPVDVSPNGSHILMSESGDWIVDLPSTLYMRVGDHTYDIAHGAPVRFIEMTKNGSMVYFSSKAQLTADDHDTSKDIFVWEESSPGQVTRVSKGLTGDNGDRDDCNQSWVEKCDIQIIDVHDPLGHENGNGNGNGNEVSDNVVANQSGDIYFVSPEQLEGAKGSFGQANIYVYHDGEVRFVASAEPQQCAEPPWGYVLETPNCEAGKIKRMEVTPDGEYAAFITKSRMTSYNNTSPGGEQMSEMYVYNRAENRLDCASCRPDGSAPTTHTFGSQNGRFITDKGKAFFSIDDPLVAADTNQANDVYEYVEGKAQLITTGVGEGAVFGGFQGDQNGPGLINVTNNGFDVYFGTMQRLVTQDHNGQELKIYDARIGGGFPADPPKPECAAADECHGAGSEPTALPKDRTSVPLEGNPKQKGNNKKPKCKKKAKKCKKAKKKKGASKRGNRHAG